MYLLRDWRTQKDAPMKRYTTTEGDQIAVNFTLVEFVSVGADERAVIDFTSGRFIL